MTKTILFFLCRNRAEILVPHALLRKLAVPGAAGFPPIGRFTVETPRKALCGKGLHNFFVEKRSDEINVFILQIRVLNQNHENVLTV
ncbi:hypothetical protein [Desulfonema ishimotonii]|uniref:hypothetical protein n=1 Tax=Desulfonema ishimotonii TaxID=45657 RepID=UPI000F581366|nr:hypothetical protein [Desulfonema ishimotonii]